MAWIGRKQGLKLTLPRWAIKEAAYKAIIPSLPLLGLPGHHVGFHTFDLAHNRGAPLLRINPVSTGATEDPFGRVCLMSSISHDGGVVVGVVLAQRAG
jgi:phosphopantetheinyl transferase (holo-ACP synthase)